MYLCVTQIKTAITNSTYLNNLWEKIAKHVGNLGLRADNKLFYQISFKLYNSSNPSSLKNSAYSS